MVKTKKIIKKVKAKAKPALKKKKTVAKKNKVTVRASGKKKVLSKQAVKKKPKNQPIISNLDNKALVSQFTEAHNQVNLEKLRDLLAPNFMSHLADFPYPLNREQYIQALSKAHDAFSDLMFTIQDLISEDDKVVVHFWIRGTHTGNYQGIKATQKRIEFPAIAIRRIKNGKIVEEWQVNDQLSLLQQLKL